MTATIESISQKLIDYFSGKPLNFSEEDYQLCRKLYGNVSASANGILYTSISLDTSKDVEYYKSLSVGDTITVEDGIFYKTPHAIPYQVRDFVDNRNEHDITHTILSKESKNHKNGRYGNVIIGVKFKWDTVLFSPYGANLTTNKNYQSPNKTLKNIEKYILDGDVKIGFIKILPYKNIDKNIQDIINSFDSIDSISSNRLGYILLRTRKVGVDENIIKKIKIEVFSKLIKNNDDFIKYLKLKNSFIEMIDVIGLKLVEELLTTHISYKIAARTHGDDDTFYFYYDDIKISDFGEASYGIYDIIVKKEIYIKAAFEYLEKSTPLEKFNKEAFKKPMYWYSLDNRGPVFVLGELLDNHSKINFKKLRATQGYKNIKENVNGIDDFINEINEKFELVYKKKITFDDFYTENSITIENIVNLVNSGNTLTIAKYGNTAIHTRFIQNMYHLYPPSGIIDNSGEAAIRQKRDFLPKVMEFLNHVDKYRSHLKI